MTIGQMIRHGLHYARTCRSLWVFGFIVALTSGGSSGGGGGGGDAGGLAIGAPSFPFEAPLWALIIVAVVALAILAILARFISEGALIEGVVRAREGRPMTAREALSAGWAHWGVLFRIALAYVAVTAVSVAAIVVPCVLAARAFGVLAGVALGLPGLILLVPWLVTIYIVQAFASRIAVLENRHALDAIAKARLFLHGRLMHALKLIVASFLGTLLIGIVGFLAVLPLLLAVVLLVRFADLTSVILLGVLVFAPVAFIITAFLGTFRSSVWTEGYLSEVPS